MDLSALSRMETLSPVVVDGVPIGESEIAREMQHHPAKNPDEARLAAARALVVRELLRREAARLDITGAPTTSDESAEDAVIAIVLERVLDTCRPGDTECRRYYDQNRERLHAPHRVRARHILVAAAPEDAERRSAAHDRASGLITELQLHPERFTELAMRHSDCPSRDDGGDLGWVLRGSTTPEFERQLFNLGPGLVARPIESRYGFHVVSVDEYLRGTELSYEQAAPLIADYLEQQGQQSSLQRYLAELHDRYEVRGLDDHAYVDTRMLR